MAKISFVDGVQCKRCGNIVADLRITTPELCQNCGARIIDKDIADRSFAVVEYGKSVTIKVTSRFFKDTFEVVE